MLLIKGDYLSSCSDVSLINKFRIINNIVLLFYLVFVIGVFVWVNSFLVVRVLKNKEKNDEEGGILWKCFFVCMVMFVI